MGKVDVFLLFLFALFRGSRGAYTTLKDVQNVFSNIVQAKDHRHRPVLNQSKPLIVRINLELVSLVDVDEVHQTMSTNVLLTLTWQDEFRTWKPVDYGGLTSVSPDPLDVWRPRLFVSNTIAERDMFKDDYAPLTVFFNGTTVWQPGGILHTSCPMRLARYPFDKHSCRFAFTTGESQEEIQFKTDHQNISLDFYEPNGEWDLSPASIDLSVEKRGREGLPSLSFNFQLQRKVSYAILCILMPVIVISSLPALVFVTPVESGERVTFSITVFLSLTFSTEQMSGNFPKNSESLPLLVIYLACLLMYSSLAVCVNLIVLLKQNKIEGDDKPSVDCAEGNDSSEDFDRTRTFVSISDKYDLLFSSAQEREERHCDARPKIGQGHHPKFRPAQKTCSRFGTALKNQTERAGCDGGLPSSSDSKRPSYFRMASVLKHMNQKDLILFVLFAGIWLVLAVVFLILQIGDYAK
ncbi:unnamed protein product [Candidula unifasciata]|uniref:Uncharacterized protein n=1 Tax=Candidula unifasciata TaxID=100452 RepID=A0A8S3ZT75_9EUPU|nr:unnamed protein product [Candidula unifasciata]